ncbi:MAG: leucine-rich repeat domain-containing protein [Candidatus Heimdallarchaeota archaeon]|nr:leucine-rich repeat domain-containing protein [Candidatus Heimdallarchaeota archaeon]
MNCPSCGHITEDLSNLEKYECPACLETFEITKIERTKNQLSISKLKSISKIQIKNTTMASFLDINFDPNLYVQRQDADLSINEFVRDQRRNLFLLLGEAGFGKTWLMAHWANLYEEKGFIVFYLTLREGLEFFFNITFGLNAEESLISIQSLSSRMSKPIIFFIDGYDEATEDLKSSVLQKIFAWLGHIENLRIVLSSRAFDWNQCHIVDSYEKQLVKVLYKNDRYNYSFYLQEYQEGEIICALDAYNLPNLDKFTFPLNYLIKYPLWVRLLGDYFRHTQLLPEVVTVDLLMQYFNRMNLKPSYYHTLSTISFHIYKKGDLAQDTSIKGEMNITHIDRLNSAGIIKLESNLGLTRLKLTNPVFGWYGTARHLVENKENKTIREEFFQAYELYNEQENRQIEKMLMDFNISIYDLMLQKGTSKTEIKSKSKKKFMLPKFSTPKIITKTLSTMDDLGKKTPLRNIKRKSNREGKITEIWSSWKKSISVPSKPTIALPKVRRRKKTLFEAIARLELVVGKDIPLSMLATKLRMDQYAVKKTVMSFIAHEELLARIIPGNDGEYLSLDEIWDKKKKKDHIIKEFKKELELELTNKNIREAIKKLYDFSNHDVLTDKEKLGYVAEIEKLEEELMTIESQKSKIKNEENEKKAIKMIENLITMLPEEESIEWTQKIDELKPKLIMYQGNEIYNNEVILLEKLQDEIEIDLEVLDEIDNETTGVIVDRNHVIGISIYNCELAELPLIIGEFKQLEYLYLTNNQIHQIQDSIEHCKNLRELKLQNNSIDFISMKLANLALLEELWLSSNNLSSIPSSVYKIKSLEVVAFESNNLQHIAEDIGNLSHLRKLYLYNNKLTTIPEILFQLVSLEELWLSYNQLSTISEHIVKLQNLKILSLESNNFSEIPLWIFQLKKLQALGLSSNSISKIPEAISSLESLQILGLDGNNITEIPDTIILLQNLISLDLQNNPLLKIDKKIKKWMKSVNTVLI